MKYNLSEMMRRAWEIVRKAGIISHITSWAFRRLYRVIFSKVFSKDSIAKYI